MKPERIESLVSWMFTGAVLIGVALFLLIRTWFAEYGNVPFRYRGAAITPQVAVGGAGLLLFIGLVLITCSVVAKLRMRR